MNTPSEPTPISLDNPLDTNTSITAFCEKNSLTLPTDALRHLPSGTLPLSLSFERKLDSLPSAAADSKALPHKTYLVRTSMDLNLLVEVRGIKWSSTKQQSNEEYMMAKGLPPWAVEAGDRMRAEERDRAKGSISGFLGKITKFTDKVVGNAEEREKKREREQREEIAGKAKWGTSRVDLWGKLPGDVLVFVEDPLFDDFGLKRVLVLDDGTEEHPGGRRTVMKRVGHGMTKDGWSEELRIWFVDCRGRAGTLNCRINAGAELWRVLGYVEDDVNPEKDVWEGIWTGNGPGKPLKFENVFRPVSELFEETQEDSEEA